LILLLVYKLVSDDYSALYHTILLKKPIVFYDSLLQSPCDEPLQKLTYAGLNNTHRHRFPTVLKPSSSRTSSSRGESERTRQERP
jgi:hypothetical protein